MMTIQHCTDVNGTTFQEQQPFLMGNVLNRGLIRNHSHYRYGFLNQGLQHHILNGIDKMLGGNLITPKDYDAILNVTLNLSVPILQMIQTMDFHKNIPLIIVSNQFEDTFSLRATIFLVFLSVHIQITVL